MYQAQEDSVEELTDLSIHLFNPLPSILSAVPGAIQLLAHHVFLKRSRPPVGKNTYSMLCLSFIYELNYFFNKKIIQTKIINVFY
jgi:hypothetical protein